MPAFGPQSLAKLQTCHPDLVRLFTEVVKTYDCQVQAGARSVADEQADIDKGVSKLSNPMDSLHVVGPTRPLALAVDVAPYPVDWTASIRFGHFAGYVLRTAEQLGIRLRWGGAWNGPYQVNDRGRFNDLDHFELVL